LSAPATVAGLAASSSSKRTYSMIMSLDGERVRFGWDTPEDEQVHASVNELVSPVGLYLYSCRVYETLVYGENAHDP
jgi:hypothetical protein